MNGVVSLAMAWSCNPADVMLIVEVESLLPLLLAHEKQTVLRDENGGCANRLVPRFPRNDVRSLHLSESILSFS